MEKDGIKKANILWLLLGFFCTFPGASHKQSTSENTYMWYIYKTPIHIYQIMTVFKEAADGQGLNWQPGWIYGTKTGAKKSAAFVYKLLHTNALRKLFVRQWKPQNHWRHWKFQFEKSGKWVSEAIESALTRAVAAAAPVPTKGVLLLKTGHLWSSFSAAAVWPSHLHLSLSAKYRLGQNYPH